MKSTKLNKAKMLKTAKLTTGELPKNGPSTIDQVLGMDVGDKFGTLNYDEYEARLNKMGLSELQDEARNVGVAAIDDSNRLRRTLLSEFRVYASNFHVPKSPAPLDISKIPKEVKDFMSGAK